MPSDACQVQSWGQIRGVLGSERWELPEFTVTEFQRRRTRYCVCVFVLNEGERFRSQLHKMKPVSAVADIVIADGGSTDGQMQPDLLAPLDVRTLLVKHGPGRLSAQMRMAFAYALAQEYQGIITIDGNDKDNPSAIPDFIAALKSGYDHVQGSRFIPGGYSINTPLHRLLAIRLLHAPLVSLASGGWYTDTTNGFRAYSRRLLLDPRVAPFRNIFSGYELHYYLAVRSRRLGYAITEIPVTRAYPRGGVVPTKISLIRGNALVLQSLLRACLHRFDPPPAEVVVTSLNGRV